MSDPFVTDREIIMEMRSDLKVLMDERITRRELEDHETRIRFLERWKYGIPATLIVAIFGFAAALLPNS